MTPRERILNALKKGPLILDELCSKIKQLDRRQIIDACTHASKAEPVLLKKSKDDITNQPLYTITEAGKKWVPIQGKRPTKVEAAPVPAPIQSAPETTNGNVIADPAKIPAPDYQPDEVCFDPVKRANAMQARAEQAEGIAAAMAGIFAEIHTAIGDPETKIDLQDLPAHIAGIRERAEKAEQDLESTLSAARKFCGWVASDINPERYPLNLYECQGVIQGTLDDALLHCSNSEKRIAELEATDKACGEIHEICAEAGIEPGHVVDRVRQLAEWANSRPVTASIESGPSRYAVASPEYLHDSKDDALQSIIKSGAEIENCIIVACHPVARVQMRPVLVPMGEAA